MIDTPEFSLAAALKWVAGGLMSVLTWLALRMHSQQDKLADRVAALETTVVSRADLNHSMDKLERRLETQHEESNTNTARIFTRLDEIADRSRGDQR